MTTTKIEKLLEVLSSGQNYTAEQLSKKTGLASVTSAVRTLRDEGYAIYLNTRGSKGSKVNLYRMAA